MVTVGYTEDQVKTHLGAIRESKLTLETLVANVALQCFIRNYTGSGAEIVRAFLIEKHTTGAVEFGSD